MNKILKKSLLIVLVSLLVIASVVSLGYIYRDGKIVNGQNLEKDLIVENRKVEPVKPPKIEELTIIAGGDIMYHMPQIRGAYRDGVYDFTGNFKYIEPYLKESDIAIANFETVAGGKEMGYSGYPNFNAPVETLRAIKAAGFDIVNTANNHILDKRKQGLLNTVKNIDEIGLKNIGTSLEGGQKYLIEEVNDIKVGFLSYTYGCNGMENTLTKEELDSIVNIIDEEKIKSDITYLKDQVDFIVTYIHWGEEYQLQANESQVKLADKIFQWGGDIILGSHPHVIQRAEKKEVQGEDKYVIYSLGNFISNQRYETLKNYNTEDGLMVRLNLKKNFETGVKTIEKVEYIPTWVYKYNKSNSNSYEILPIDDVLERKYEIYNYNKAIGERMFNSKNRTINRINE